VRRFINYILNLKNGYGWFNAYNKVDDYLVGELEKRQIEHEITTDNLFKNTVEMINKLNKERG